MAKLHVTQISGYIKKNLSGKIDVSDYDKHPRESDREKSFLTRALAVTAVSQLTEESPDLLCPFVTDGSKDGGVDLIYFDKKEKTLYLAQTKWHEEGRGSISQAEMIKFINGVKKILSLDISRLNQKIKNRRKDIESAVFDANAKIVLVIAHTGSDSINEDVLEELEEYISSQNDSSEIMSKQIIDQALIHKSISLGISGKAIDVDVQIQNWGAIREPKKAVYGRVFASDIAELFDNHRNKLFEKNIRQVLHKSQVNQDLVDTLKYSPEIFWYYNNGITAVARKILKKPLGGNSTDSGIWECSGFSIVNGAQTVGAIHAASKVSASTIGNATVLMRIIESGEDDEEFEFSVTKNTNTQNSVVKRDFVALDPQQERIKNELKFEKIDYHYKSGSTVGNSDKAFDLLDATIALTCINTDVGLAVQAKREISKLWDDITKAPYKTLFNSSISGPQIWNIVRTHREIESIFDLISETKEGREKSICIHGNRFLQWATFRELDLNKNSSFNIDHSDIIKSAHTVLSKLIEITQGSPYKESYPASLFKNVKKCRDMADLMK